MNVTELKSLARELGITGFSSMKKAELEAAIALATSPKRLSTNDRMVTYKAQNGSARLTARQERRIRHKENKAKK